MSYDDSYSYDGDSVWTIEYTNWKGETRIRKIDPIRIHWGSTEHHPEPQFLLRALDMEITDREVVKDFAIKGILRRIDA